MKILSFVCLACFNFQAVFADYRVLIDEDTNFIRQLNGSPSNETTDVFKGQLATKVLPNQSYNTNIAGWNYPITETGLRYVLFAWKKVGGSKMQIQLKSIEKNWTRYHAGIQSVYNPSISVMASLPTDWTYIIRDLYQDFGAMTLTGLAITPNDGQYGLFDRFILGTNRAELESLVNPQPTSSVKTIFDEDESFINQLNGSLSNVATDVYTGKVALKVLPNQSYAFTLKEGPWAISETGLRYMLFAWKKVGGSKIQIQLNSLEKAWTRYHAGGQSVYNPSISVMEGLPTEWTYVVRDLYQDFGAMTLTGLAFTPNDGEYGLFDCIYLAKTRKELEALIPAAWKQTSKGLQYANRNVVIGDRYVPGSKLSVDGKITAQEVEVSIDNWADFVFEPNYPLMPLSELKGYLAEEKHLPGIPSATEVTAKGVNLGDMQRMMLQKIEELTLHSIRLEEEIEALKKQH